MSKWVNVPVVEFRVYFVFGPSKLRHACRQQRYYDDVNMAGKQVKTHLVGRTGGQVFMAPHGNALKDEEGVSASR